MKGPSTRAGLGALVPVTVVAALALAACSSGSHAKAAAPSTLPQVSNPAASQVTTRFGPCQPLPAPGPTPAWFPPDLPLPDGSYAVGEVPGAPPSFHKGVWAVNASLRDFVQRTALGQWRDRGWHLGRGDAETGEADDEFRRGSEAGTFRARSVYCDTGWTELVVTFTSAAP